LAGAVHQVAGGGRYLCPPAGRAARRGIRCRKAAAQVPLRPGIPGALPARLGKERLQAAEGMRLSVKTVSTYPRSGQDEHANERRTRLLRGPERPCGVTLSFVLGCDP
jgi:hypothetical protein